jgi:hypothetical protein
MKRKGHSLQTWDDVYFDGLLNPTEEYFDEEAQEIIKHIVDDGWDSYEEDEQDEE